MTLSAFQDRLLDALQEGLALCERPFEELAVRLGADERRVLEQTAALKEQEVIRRLRGQVDYRKLGRVATLAAAQVPGEKLEATAAAVSVLAGVSHNYLRDHAMNLWFTLQDESFEAIDRALVQLHEQTGVTFYSFPAVRLFKLDVRFGTRAESSNPATVPMTNARRPAELTDAEKTALALLQREVPLVSRPFAALAGESGESELLEAARSLRQKGVLRKIAAVANQYRLGYGANAVFCAEIPPEHVERIGLFLARYRQVSHCYERKTAPAWPYNLYAMIHVHTEEMMQAWVEELTQTLRIDNYVLLRTVRELKKEPVVIEFP